jgi:excisionase family DNA binding protein
MRNSCTCDTSPDPSPDTSPDSSLEGDGKTVQQGEVQRPLLLTVKEAAALIGIGRSTLYRLMEAGEVDSIHIGTSRRIPLQSAYAFVERVTGSTISHHPGRAQA